MIRRIKYCECGCGQEIVFKRYHKYKEVRFLPGHQFKGKNNPMYGVHLIPWNKDLTKETDVRILNIGKKISKILLKTGSHKGKNNSMYGRHHTEESKRKNSDFHKGKLPWNKNLTKKTDFRVERGAKALSKTRKERIASGEIIIIPWNKNLTKETDERVLKASEKLKGHIGWNKDLTKKTDARILKISKTLEGTTLSEKRKRNISKTMIEKGISKGENNPAWKGGISFEPYTQEFNDELKKTVRYRDNYQCQLCGIPELESGKKLSIHHIDYVKKNCKPFNLISLCTSCHSKTQFNRLQWQKYFTNKIEETMNSKITKYKRIKPKHLEKICFKEGIDNG